MDHFSELERLEVIDLTPDDEDNGYNNCPNGSSSVSKMTSSGICHKFSNKAPANILAMQEINDTEAPGGTTGLRQCDENNLVHGRSGTHPRVSNSPFYLRLPSKNMKPPWANSYTMKSANMLSRPKQQIDQRPLQVDNSAVQIQHVDSPKLSSEEGHLLQCRQLKGEAQVSSFLPYSHKRVLIDNNASVPPQSEGILNGSLQMNGCPRPDQLPLLHHHKECRDPMGPVCRTARENLKRNSQGVTTSEILLAMAGSPSIVTTDNMPPPKRMKLENTSKDGTSDEGIKAERGDKCRNSVVIVRQLEEENQVQIESSKHKMELESTIISTSSNGLMLGANSERPKMKGLSLVESFSKEELREHIISLRQSDDLVLGVEGLVVRVVSSINKILEVNKRFREIFRNEEYPAEFPYKSKAIFLFQKIDGADVCLFGMYVQEFGSECAVPNQRLVCISYLDSVKYFRPEIKAANREALRTFVYHNILIGYLDYCKKRGFMSCYIWSCPPINKDDYILYCHPTTQKLPMRQSLRRWYRKLVQRAQTETVVVEHTNLYDRYFKPPSYCTAKVTASRLPYFDGDWWLGETENFFKEYVCHKEETMTAIDCGVRKAKRQLLSRDTEDSLLIDYLAKKIGSIKKDFIMVHFQHTCQHCSQHIVCGSRWVTKENLNLCDECYSVEQEKMKKSKKERVYYKEVKAESVPTDTNDEDENLHSEYVDTRFMLLNLCQRKNYQFDTLRRAKHSTMMILYHLHEERKKQQQQQRWKKLLDILVHASECSAPRCTYRGCCLLKHLSHHVKVCETRAKNGCTQCMKMWQILKVHARNCKESECSLPRCRDLKENMALFLTTRLLTGT